MGAIRRTRIEHQDFICKGDEHHRFRAAVKMSTSDNGDAIERSAEFMVTTADKASRWYGWLTIPMCPVLGCDSIAEESATYDPALATVPAAERMQVWLSPDGRRVSVPGKRDAVMPSRYLAAGYRTIEAHSMRDIDRIEAIRAEQTGNEVFSELNFDESRRRWHQEADYDPEDMSSLI